MPTKRKLAKQAKKSVVHNPEDVKPKNTSKKRKQYHSQLDPTVPSSNQLKLTPEQENFAAHLAQLKFDIETQLREYYFKLCEIEYCNLSYAQKKLKIKILGKKNFPTQLSEKHQRLQCSIAQALEQKLIQHEWQRKKLSEIANHNIAKYKLLFDTYKLSKKFPDKIDVAAAKLPADYQAFFSKEGLVNCIYAFETFPFTSFMPIPDMSRMSTKIERIALGCNEETLCDTETENREIPHTPSDQKELLMNIAVYEKLPRNIQEKQNNISSDMNLNIPSDIESDDENNKLSEAAGGFDPNDLSKKLKEMNIEQEFGSQTSVNSNSAQNLL